MKDFLDRTRLFSILSVLLAFVVVFTLLLSTVYSSYVSSIKKGEVLEAYNEIITAADDPDQLRSMVTKCEFQYNIKIFVVFGFIDNSLMPFPRQSQRNYRETPTAEYFHEILQNEKYIYLDEKDPSNNDFLTFIGRLSSTGYMFVRVPTSFVAESVRYTINFVIVSAIIALMLAIAVAYYFSGREQKIDNMKQNILINVSHDLKTPIFLIQSYAEGLKQNINDNKEDKDFYCDVILDETRRMGKMVKEILTLAKMESTKTPLNMTQFQLTDVINDIINKNKIKIQDKAIHLSLRIHNVNVFADKSMIESAITNIITNAIDHAPVNGKIEIYTGLKRKRIRLLFYNNGPAIPKEEQDNIWQTFYKLDTNIKKEYGGTGVGLSVVRTVMENHDCKYGVISQDKGVTFYIDIKRKPI